MNGHFVVVDDTGIIAGVFADDVSAQEQIDALRLISYPLEGEARVKALCPECAEHLEREDGVCAGGAEQAPGVLPYVRTVPVMQAVLEGLRSL